MKHRADIALIAIIGLLALVPATNGRGRNNGTRPGASPGAHGQWTTLENCVLVSNRSNDGDSFHVSTGGKQYLFRLYFVDAPETDMSFKDRVAEQAKYFALTPAQTTAVGKVAEDFTREKLGQPFTVRTCFQDALGRSKMERFYAIVQTATGDLAEQLTENGLARIHGASANPIGLPPANAEWQKLRQLESEARSERVGGWGVKSGRMTERSAKAKNRSAGDPFDAFFHREREQASAPTPTSNAWPFPPRAIPLPLRAPTPLPIAAVSPAARVSTSTTPAKLDPNTATADQLKALPGIGKVLAQRIVAARPFKSADALRRVKGIGDARFEKIRPFFE